MSKNDFNTKNKKFEFGANWEKLLRKIDEETVDAARRSLGELLGAESFVGLTFLDIGCGSGLFSLAARRMGAKVETFDFDNKSVLCATELKNRFCETDDLWQIYQGDILDISSVKMNKESADIVYSWGVLHHTGKMWEALGNAITYVRKGGKLCIAIYNDQQWRSKRWEKMKKRYTYGGTLTKKLVLLATGLYLLAFYMRDDLHNYGDMFYRLKKTNKKQNRGMAVSEDLTDWAGGYPFEVAKPEEIIAFCISHGFALKHLITQGKGHGCNQFVFERNAI